MPDGSERSAAEREAARLERERRRAQRQGAALPIEERPAPAEPGPERFEAPPARFEAPPERFEAPAERFEAPAERLGAPPEPAELPEPPAFSDDGAIDHDEPELGDEQAAGTRRVSRLDRIRAGQQPAPRARRRGSAGISHGRTRVRRIGALIALVLGIALLWFLDQLFQPFQGSGHGSVTVTIPPHSSSSQVGDLLARDGVISSSFFFELRATLAGDRGDLRSGAYHLKLGMSYGDVLKVLTAAPPAVPSTEVTIVPGRTRRQIDALLKAQGVKGSYFDLTRSSKILRPQSYGAPRSTNSLEGFLFPDSYRLGTPIKLTHLIADQLRRFKQEFATINLSYARSRHLTPYEVLIIASMVEAESATAHDRPLIASVIYNRLRLGMPLQIDATTRYAVNNYTTPLTQSQLSSSSPYNTRLRPGLPPTPIDNPALASIEATARPAHTNFLYFVVKPCGNGEQTFTADYNYFLKLVAQYQSARARLGGRSPAKC